MPNPHAKLTRWEPKKWKPQYEIICGLHANGMSNIEIADKAGRTPQQISNILCCEQGKRVIAEITAALHKKNTQTLPEMYAEIAQKTARLTLKLFDNEDVVQKSPFALIDRGLRVSEGAGKLKRGNDGVNIGNATINALPPALIERMSEALEKAQVVKELHSGQDVSDVKTGTDG